MNEYIKTAQELAKLPGTDKWQWKLFAEYSDEARTKLVEPLSLTFYWRGVADDFTEHRMMCEEVYWKALGPFLKVEAFSEWSAAKWLERAGVCLDYLENRDGRPEPYLCFRTRVYDTEPLVKMQNDLPTELDYNKAILAIGQRAFGLGDHFDTGLDIDRQPWLEAWNRGQDV